MADEDFHWVMVLLVVSVSVAALFIGCRRHQDRRVLFLGGLGLLVLAATALTGHDLLGGRGERVATLAGGVILAWGHRRNCRPCRRDGCGD